MGGNKQTSAGTPAVKSYIPREGGVLGVWLASVVYGVLVLVKTREVLGLNEWLAILASIIGVPLTALAMNAPPGIGRLKRVAPAVILYLPVIYSTWPSSIYYSIVALALLIVALKSKGLRLILAGGPLVAGLGGGIALSSMSPVLSLFPIAYTMLTVSIASARVTGEYGRLLVPVVLGASAVLSSTVGLYQYCRGAAFLLVLDVVARLSLYLVGVYERVSVRVYGIHEAIHTLLVFLIVAWFC